jgi:transcriptional antiterminator RfaH
MVWAVAQIKLNAEKVAIANLRRQHYQVLSPSIPVQKLRRNKLETIDAPLFPGYLLVQSNGLRWMPINSTLGVMRLLTRQSSVHEYREPCTISDRFIESLRCCSFNNGDDDSHWSLHPGTRVKILHGGLAGHTAIVAWSNEQRCRLLIEILGREDVPITLDIGDVAAV